MTRAQKIWGMRPESLQLAAAAVFAAGVWVATHRRPTRNRGPARAFERPRPLRRVRPRLHVVDGGQPQEDAARSTTIVAANPDPFEALLQDLFHADPHGGGFYALRKGDTPETVARAVLSEAGKFTRQNLLDYIHCFSSSRFNLDRYGSPSTSRAYPREWLVPGFGQGLRAAFLPRNADAIEAIAHGRLPPRTIDPRTGAPLGDGEHLGILWLPPVSAKALRKGTVTCAHQTWSDGSSSIEPPPEFFAFMEAA